MLIGKTSTVAVPRDLCLNHRPALPRSAQRAVIIYCLVLSWKRLGSMRSGEKMFSLLLHGFSELCCAWVGGQTQRRAWSSAGGKSVSQHCGAAVTIHKGHAPLCRLETFWWWWLMAELPRFELREDQSSLHWCNKQWDFTFLITAVTDSTITG